MCKYRKMKIIAVLSLMFFSGSLFSQPISQYLYGQNHWMATGDEDDRTGYIDQLWPQVKQSGVTMVRIGGNAYERNFPDRAKLNAMIDNIKGIGAEPLLQVPRFFTDLQAKELVEYYTEDNSRKVQFWSVGNEPRLHDEDTLDQVHSFLLRLTKAMRDVSTDITIFAYDEAWLRMPDYEELIGGVRDITGLKHNGAWLIDGVTFHSYPNGEEFTRDDVVFSAPQGVAGSIAALVGLISKANEKHSRSGKDALMWGLTEFNVTYKNPDREVTGYGNTSFLGGQFMAEVFGFGMQYQAKMMNPWCINEVDRVATDFGYLGMPSEFHPRSTYYHMQMMSEHMLDEFLPSKNNQDYVKTIATSSKKRIALLIMNQDQNKDFDFVVNFSSGINKGAKAEVSPPLVIELEGKSSKKFLGKIPAQSSALYVFNKKGKLKKHISYGVKENLKHLPPLVN